MACASLFYKQVMLLETQPPRKSNYIAHVDTLAVGIPHSPNIHKCQRYITSA